MIERIIAVE